MDDGDCLWQLLLFLSGDPQKRKGKPPEKKNVIDSISAYEIVVCCYVKIMLKLLDIKVDNCFPNAFVVWSSERDCEGKDEGQISIVVGLVMMQWGWISVTPIYSGQYMIFGGKFKVTQAP